MDDAEYYSSIIRVFFSQDVGDIEWFENISIVGSFINVLLSLTATLGNGMIIVAILRSQNLQTPSYLLITSLAFTDLLMGLIYHPLQVAILISYLDKNIKAFIFITEAFMYTSVFLSAISLTIMTCIAIDRYLALKLKHRYRVVVTKKRVRLVVVIAWIFILVLTTLITFRRRLDAILYASMSCIAVLSLSVTCIFYIKMFKTLHLYTVQVQAQQPNPLAGNFDVVRYKKTLKTMLVVLGCFLLCSVPITCATIAMVMFDFDRETALLQTIVVAIFGLNSSINPVIYVMRFPDIRNACREILKIGS